jgi:nitroreductase
MNVNIAIKQRSSIRGYKNTPIPNNVLNQLLESARLAPSASNRQEWKFIVVKDPARKKALAKAASNQFFIAEAPVIIIAVSTAPDHIMRCDVPGYPVDLAIAVDHITLQAVELGLGTCWICAFSQNEVRKVLNIPDKYKVVTLLPVGYPDAAPEPKDRKSLEEIICYETFS